MLEQDAASQLERHLREEGVLRHVSVIIRLDTEDRSLTINFGPGYLPGKYDSYGERFLYPMASSLRFYAEKSGLEVNDIRFLFEGRALEAYFPEDLAVSPRKAARSLRSSVLVSSSHGYIALHPTRAWEYQRPAPLGIQEDTLSPVYGDELEALIVQRSGLAVHRARSRSDDLHPESGKPWEHMSSRYHLKALFPDRLDMWNEFPDSPNANREVDEDIRAQPNYANHLGVDAMLSLHTNGHDSAAVRGAEVYHHRSKPEDKALGDSILCAMREIIHAQEGYEEFPIRTQSNPASHGENRIGTMPSVIVETAYHSNPEDVAALQDPVFRTASMKGVEKGYRLFREGKDCQPLAADLIESIRLSQGQEQQVDVPFKGYPQYPIELITTNVGCPPGWTCTDGKVHIEAEGAKPSQVTMRCDNGRSGPTFWETRVVDADGVKSPAVRHSVQCIRNSRDADGLVDPAGTITAVSS
ncbi:MAG: hypothetical protein GAK31_00421 [Stenotrophomonas maltophilia]|uniref:MurNAc-LAA domain-containing protein n=1 Tax=Stenotrophomonas maltophilia TaxID=40324 RepID=A0A7V8FJH2_STEMA|nr:MAG: hypothetical protein GAK31_00421 [Stenotrophomonas maltophilia]